MRKVTRRSPRRGERGWPELLEEWSFQKDELPWRWGEHFWGSAWPCHVSDGRPPPKWTGRGGNWLSES